LAYLLKLYVQFLASGKIIIDFYIAYHCGEMLRSSMICMVLLAGVT